MYACRECERVINQATEICPFCGADLTAAPAGEPSAPGKKPSLASVILRWGILLAILTAALWSFLWFVVPEQSGDPATRAEAQAVAALAEVRVVLGDYADAQGFYPASLEALGERARGSAQRALSEGYQLQYTPGSPNSDGAVRNYALLARSGKYGYRNFYTDETGLVRATRENRPATPQDPTI